MAGSDDTILWQEVKTANHGSKANILWNDVKTILNDKY